MADIQSSTAEISRGKKKKKDRKIETTGVKYIDLTINMAIITVAIINFR